MWKKSKKHNLDIWLFEFLLNQDLQTHLLLKNIFLTIQKQGRHTVQNLGGGDSNVVGIICPPPGWNRVKVAAKTWCGHLPTSRPWPEPLQWCRVDACLFVYWFFATVWQAVYKTDYFCINELETSRHFASQTFAFASTVLLVINYTFYCWYDKSGLLKFDVILNTVLCWAISTWDDDILLSCSFVWCGLLPLKLMLGFAKMSSLHKQSLANQGKN